MNVNDFTQIDISNNGKWAIGVNCIQHNPSDEYDSKFKQTKYHILKIQNKNPKEEIHSFIYEENYNKYADVQEYIGIRKYEWKDNSKLYLESAQGESDTIDLESESKEDIINRISILENERKIF